MIPNIEILTTPLEDSYHPNKTYRAVVTKIEPSEKEVYKTRIKGHVDGLNALEQTIYFILGTERYQFPIYSWDYGIELKDLFGKPMTYVISELPRRIKEALMYDERVKDVTDFEFDKNGKKLHVTFKVVSEYGDIKTDLEVSI